MRLDWAERLYVLNRIVFGVALNAENENIKCVLGRVNVHKLKLAREWNSMGIGEI